MAPHSIVAWKEARALHRLHAAYGKSKSPESAQAFMDFQDRLLDRLLAQNHPGLSNYQLSVAKTESQKRINEIFLHGTLLGESAIQTLGDLKVRKAPKHVSFGPTAVYLSFSAFFAALAAFSKPLADIAAQLGLDAIEGMLRQIRLNTIRIFVLAALSLGGLWKAWRAYRQEFEDLAWKISEAIKSGFEKARFA